MIESNLVIEDVIKREPSLEDYYSSRQTDWTNQFKDAFTELIEDVRNRNFNIRKLCKRLSLESSVTKTAVFTGTKSSEDLLQRLRVCIEATSKDDGTIIYDIQGTNDDSDETYTTIKSIEVFNAGKTTSTLDQCYKFYRLNITDLGTSTTVTYSAYLVETSFERLHLYKTLEYIYGSLIALDQDTYTAKRDYYRAEYLDLLNSTNFAYDEDDDGEIEDIEKNRNNTRVTLRP
jgi:hypothetical protein